MILKTRKKKKNGKCCMNKTRKKPEHFLRHEKSRGYFDFYFVVLQIPAICSCIVNCNGQHTIDGSRMSKTGRTLSEMESPYPLLCNEFHSICTIPHRLHLLSDFQLRSVAFYAPTYVFPSPIFTTHFSKPCRSRYNRSLHSIKTPNILHIRLESL